jgi:hypothetical protein
LSIHGHRFSFKHLCWHSITKILRNGPRAHFPFTTVYGGNEAHGISAGSSIVETAGSVREELEAEHHLRVEKARDSLRSYSTEVLGPHVGFPLRRGTNED